jgi:L-arabinose isomerase
MAPKNTEEEVRIGSSDTRRPRIGILFLAGESWWEAGVSDAKEGPYAGFLNTVERDVRAITAELSKGHDVVTSGLLHTVKEAVEEARRFNEARVDAVVFCPIIWTNDAPVVAFIQEARKVPVVMWAYDPYRGFPEYFKIEVWLRASGPVSVQQSSNIFKRFGWEYEVVFGNEEEDEVLTEIGAFVRAAAVKKSLNGTRIAVLPSPCRVVISSWIDEFYLLERFGVELDYVSVETFGALVNGIKDKDALGYVNHLKKNYPVDGVDDTTLLESARQSLAFVRLMEDRGLSGIALEDFHPDIYRVFGFRPHLCHPRFGELGCTVGFEADVPGVLATVIAGRLAGRMGMFNEFFSVDRRANAVLMGHPGHGEVSVGDPETFRVTYDLEFDASQKRGAWLSYRAKAGEMTFLNFTPEYGKLKACAFRGRALGGPRLMEGYSHMLVEPKRPDGSPGDAVGLFTKIVKLGLMQHWGTVHGDIGRELKCLSKMLGLELITI